MNREGMYILLAVLALCFSVCIILILVMEQTLNDGGSMKHFFVRDGKNYPVACVATEEQAAEGQSPVIFYGLSICNPLDYQNFNRRLAAKIAEERLARRLSAGTCDRIITAKDDSIEEENRIRWSCAKTGEITVTENINPKLQLLQTLQADTRLPKHFRNAVAERIPLLEANIAAKKMRRVVH